ncbi:hypothetical protein ACIGO8_33035 [Streptomyces sp. NPDC053493]|uniref:hypothetical protein n=1 Tax=Streptomyces sp. NPDC053493 TaxID=3365705 RepID=UPI0037D4F5FF
MCALIYRLLDAEIYLHEDGSFTHTPNEGDEVQDLTEAPDSMGPLYVGNRICRLPLFRDGLINDPGILALKESCELVTMGADLVSFALALENWLNNTPPSKDPNLVLLEKLHAQMKQVQDFQLASWVTSREETIDDLKADAYTAIQTVHGFFDACNAAHTNVTAMLENNAFWANKMAIADTDTKKAVTRLMGSSLWMRPNSVAAMSGGGDPMDPVTGWMYHMADRAPETGFHQVWDHRWPLPALLYAMSARICVMRAVNPSLTSNAGVVTEIKQYIDYLSNIWIQMSDGVRHLKFEDYTAKQKSALGNSGYIPTFAADINGGEFIGGTAYTFNIHAPSMWNWHGPRPPGDLVASSDFGNFFEWFGVKKLLITVGGWAHGQVADAIGLQQLIRYCAQLHALIDPSRRLPFLDWQRSVDDIMSDDDRRKDALAAARIVELTPEPQGENAPSRSFYIYEALHANHGETAELVGKYADDLFRLGVANQAAPSRKR